MRAAPTFSYVMTKVTPVPEIFNFIAKHSGNNDQEMYGNFSMGAGYAIYLPAAQAQTAVDVAAGVGLKAWVAGRVEAGSKRVVIKPKSITFSGDSLEVR